MIMADNNNDDANEELFIDRSHIECDCCGKPGPTKNCSRCLSYYYCNRECQLKHWKDHKHHCSALKEKYDLFQEKRHSGEKEEDDGKRDSEPDECAICLEEIELPIALDCGHVFCVSCLVQYQATNPVKNSCPNCRGDAQNIGLKASGQMVIFTERAKKSKGAERDVYVNLVLRQIDAAAFSRHSSFKDHLDSKDRLVVDTIFAKTTVLGELNMHREVIDTVDKFMNICDTANDIRPYEIMHARLGKGKAHVGLEEWQSALDVLKPLYEDCKKKHQEYLFIIAANICRAEYELGNYQEATLQGCRAAYRQYRYFAGVHKYIALSQMKMGDIAAAKKSITRGIFHEEQWDEENKKENKEVLRMILAEEAKNNKSKGKKKGKKKKGRGRKK